MVNHEPLTTLFKFARKIPDFLYTILTIVWRLCHLVPSFNSFPHSHMAKTAEPWRTESPQEMIAAHAHNRKIHTCLGIWFGIGRGCGCGRGWECVCVCVWMRNKRNTFWKFNDAHILLPQLITKTTRPKRNLSHFIREVQWIKKWKRVVHGERSERSDKVYDRCD